MKKNKNIANINTEVSVGEKVKIPRALYRSGKLENCCLLNVREEAYADARVIGLLAMDDEFDILCNNEGNPLFYCKSYNADEVAALESDDRFVSIRIPVAPARGVQKELYGFCMAKFVSAVGEELKEV